MRSDAGPKKKGMRFSSSEASEAQAGAGEVMVNSREGMKEKNCKSSATGLLLFFEIRLKNKTRRKAGWTEKLGGKHQVRCTIFPSLKPARRSAHPPLNLTGVATTDGEAAGRRENFPAS